MKKNQKIKTQIRKEINDLRIKAENLVEFLKVPSHLEVIEELERETIDEIDQLLERCEDQTGRKLGFHFNAAEISQPTEKISPRINKGNSRERCIALREYVTENNDLLTFEHFYSWAKTYLKEGFNS